MDFSRVRYLFQIPISWFKAVDVRVFGNHPATGIRFWNQSDGSLAIGADLDFLDDRYGSGGTVKSVDGVLPDSSGNVNLDRSSDPPLRSSDIGESVAAENHTHTDLSNAIQTAQSTANNAATAAANAGSAAAGAAQAATAAQSTATDAQTTATAAQATAETADGKADENAADIADLDASLTTCQSIANQAKDKADAAVEGLQDKSDVGHTHTKSDISDLTGFTGSITVVTGVSWNGTVLKFSNRMNVYSNGLLTSSTVGQDTTIDTPVAVDITV